MVSRFCTVGLAVALAVWTTGCERHSWTEVSEFYRGHHGAHEAHAEGADPHAPEAKHAPDAKPHADEAKPHSPEPAAPKPH